MSPVEVTPDLLRAMALPRPDEGSKDDRGRVLVVAGSVEVGGAARLSGEGALRAGAGKLKLATVESLAPHLAMAVPEAMVIGLAETPDGGIDPDHAGPRLRPMTEACDAVLIGPGMTEGDATTSLVVALCARATSSFVLDAAALCGLKAEAAAMRSCEGGLVMTPHAGEMAQFLGRSREEVEADPLRAAREAAELLRAVVVMKGAQTYIVRQDGAAWVFKGGSVGLATSGSGDVLAGIVVGLLARGATPIQAALWGVYLHGEAGRLLADRIGPLGFLAREIAPNVPGIMRDLGDGG